MLSTERRREAGLDKGRYRSERGVRMYGLPATELIFCSTEDDEEEEDVIGR